MSDWWARTVREAKPQHQGGSTQGYYILTPDGHGVTWDNYIPRLEQFLDRGIREYARARKGKANVSRADVREFAPQEPPEGTSVIRLYTRIRPVPEGADPMNRLLGLDYMWILRDEMRDILRSTENSTREVEMPPTLVARLTVFHLIDNVRGQVWSWQPRDVRKANFRVKAAGGSGQTRKFTFTGDFAKQSSNPPAWTARGHEGKIDGEFEVDTKTEKIVRFRMFADCTAWSDQGGNFRPPSGRYKIVTAAIEATDELAQQIAPEPANTGNHYLRSRLGNR
ncbi:MAG: hypothetical protein HZA46_15625 [Planctomycetales bacterium]|nr:hypothetical protein [Planctomycetales bacterium]